MLAAIFLRPEIMKNPDILKISTLTGDWCDNDIVLLHACFQLLADCIEKEHLFMGHVDWTLTEESKATKREIEELYEWWKKRRNLQVTDGWSELEKTQYDKDTEMLIRLIKIRQHLWT